MNDDKVRAAAEHQLHINARGQTDITGVREVLSFDEGEVRLVTECGEMTIEGTALKVGTLDTQRGVVSVGGRVDGVYYVNDTPRRKRGLFGRGRD